MRIQRQAGGLTYPLILGSRSSCSRAIVAYSEKRYIAGESSGANRARTGGDNGSKALPVSPGPSRKSRTWEEPEGLLDYPLARRCRPQRRNETGSTENQTRAGIRQGDGNRFNPRASVTRAGFDAFQMQRASVQTDAIPNLP